MTRFVTLVGLDLRELWMSFRLLLVLAALLGSALVLVLVSASGVDLPQGVAYAAGMAVAAIVTAAAAAHSVAADRRDGSAAWLVVRAVPRSALLLAWLAAFVLPLAAGFVASGVVAWLTLSVDARFADAGPPFALAVAAAGAGALAAVALGAMLGAVLAPWRAVVATVVILLLVGAATLLLPSSSSLPSGGFALIGALPSVERPMAQGLASMGSALVAVGMLSAGAAAFLERADL